MSGIAKHFKNGGNPVTKRRQLWHDLNRKGYGRGGKMPRLFPKPDSKPVRIEKAPKEARSDS